MESVFSFYSKGSDSITQQEALKVVQSVGQVPSTQEFKEALLEANIGNQASITLDDMELILEILWNDNELEAILRESSKKFDKNQTGIILFG